MAENEITSMLASLAGDSHRCAPIAASAIRRRGDRRRVAVRVVATGSTMALVGATAGTAYAVGSAHRSESFVTTPADGSGHTAPAPVAATKSPAPVAPLPSKRHLRRELAAARAHLARHRERLSRLRARHHAGAVGDARFQERRRELKSKIATDRKRIAVIKQELRERRSMTAPAAAPSSG